MLKMVVPVSSLLFCYAAFFDVVREASAITCGCGVTGAPSVALTDYVNAPTGKQDASYCLNGRSCTPQAGYGCYRVTQDATTSANFCGAGLGKGMTAGNQLLWLIGAAGLSSLPNLGTCTAANRKSKGVCYCDVGDYCNTNAAGKPQKFGSAGDSLARVGIALLFTAYLLNI